MFEVVRVAPGTVEANLLVAEYVEESAYAGGFGGPMSSDDLFVDVMKYAMYTDRPVFYAALARTLARLN